MTPTKKNQGILGGIQSKSQTHKEKKLNLGGKSIKIQNPQKKKAQKFE